MCSIKHSWVRWKFRLSYSESQESTQISPYESHLKQTQALNKRAFVKSSIKQIHFPLPFGQISYSKPKWNTRSVFCVQIWPTTACSCMWLWIFQNGCPWQGAALTPTPSPALHSPRIIHKSQSGIRSSGCTVCTRTCPARKSGTGHKGYLKY